MNILLPIEIINREIDFKLVLAAFLSGKGHKIYIGEHHFLMNLVSHMKEGGLYVGKNIFSKESFTEKGEQYYLLKKKNFNIIYLHEEGGVFAGDEKNYKKLQEFQYKTDFFDKNDQICVWGNFQKKVDEARSKNKSINVTGHPRFDLCKSKWHDLYSYDVSQIKKKYKKFILIDSNCTAGNFGMGLKYLYTKKIYKDQDLRLKFINNYVYETKQIASMVYLTHMLAAKFPKINFVYRPHPSENIAYYKLIFSGVKNIHVKHEGAVLHWILASKLVVHDNCTTAIEAALAGKPVISYKAHQNKDRNVWLANEMGFQTNNINEIISYLNKAIEDKLKFKINLKNKKMSKYLYNLDGNSYDKLLKVIDKKIDNRISNSNLHPYTIKKYFINLKLKKFIKKSFNKKHNLHIKYNDHKFYGFHKNEISKKLQLISKHLKKKITYKIHNSHCLIIE